MFNNNLKALRENKHLSQRKVADHFELKYSTYNDWEQNRVMLSIEKADMFALYYEVSITTVLGINNNINKHKKLKPLNYDKLLDNLNKLKTKNNDSFTKIGKALFCKRQVAHRYFSNQRKISVDVLYKLARYYEVDIDTLCGKTDKEIEFIK